MSGEVRLSAEERAGRRQAAINEMVTKGYTPERAEEVIDMVAKVLFGPGGRFAGASVEGQEHQDDTLGRRPGDL